MNQHHPHPGYGMPTPQPPKKTNVGKIIGLGCAGIIGLVVVIGIISALASSGGDSNTDSTSTAKSSAPAAQQTAKTETTKEEPKKTAPIAITAKKTAFTKTILATGSDYTSVLVTITNNSSDAIDVNPLYLTITDTSGAKHTAELAVDENQIDTVTLAPGENVSGTITGKGKFTAKYVTYTDGLIGDSVRANVS